MTQPTLQEWLNRGKPTKKRTPMKRIGAKRRKELRIYAKKRKAFLEAHPECMAHGIICSYLWEYDRLSWEKAPWAITTKTIQSTEIHHMKKPKCKYLNDEKTWLAVCRWSHDWIENNKKTARTIGLLQ